MNSRKQMRKSVNTIRFHDQPTETNAPLECHVKVRNKDDSKNTATILRSVFTSHYPALNRDIIPWLARIYQEESVLSQPQNVQTILTI